MAAADSSPKKILIVEDEEAVRALINRILSRSGYAITTASNGLDGLEKLGEETFDLVISDIVMPSMKGTQMVRELRKRDPDIGVIYVTGYPQDDAFELGKNDHLLLKPFNQEQLKDMVKEALAGIAP